MSGCWAHCLENETNCSETKKRRENKNASEEDGVNECVRQ